MDLLNKKYLIVCSCIKVKENKEFQDSDDKRIRCVVEKIKKKQKNMQRELV